MTETPDAPTPDPAGAPPGPAAAPPSPYATPYGAYPAPPVPAGMYYDQASGVVLPQGVVLASNGRRIGAYFLAIPLVIVTLVIGYVVWGLIVWGRGTTPALQVLGMRCWRPQDQRVASWGWMALREIVGRLAEGILGIITELISFILMLSNNDRRSLHDMIAGTVVVHDPGKVLGRPRTSPPAFTPPAAAG